MNFIFVSPQFPHTYWEFCHRLKQNGVTVLGIGDTPYESLSNELKGSLDDWYYVPNMEDYDRMYRAVAFLASKWGRIDWIESNNEYWLAQDARFRTDFNVRTGIQTDHIDAIKEKSEMKRYYALAGVPSARQIKAAEGEEAVRAFAGKTCYPVFAKPDIGVGANGTYKIDDSAALSAFFRDEREWQHYVVEEFVSGDIASYDAIVGQGGEPLFESMTMWPPSVADIVKGHLDLSYYVSPVMPEQLRERGRTTVKAFGVFNRFVHLEFFVLGADRPGLGKKGDYVGLEVNMRPAGGYTPDMINFSHSIDVYKIWADMVAYGKSDVRPGEQYYCAFASRRDEHRYRHTHEEILSRYGKDMVMCERMQGIMVSAMGDQMYTVRLKTFDEMTEFDRFVHERES